MNHYKYLIVGGGMAAASAVAGIREIDKAGSIGLISEEGFPPYDRPPLSKSLWKGKPLERIFRDFGTLNASLILDRKAKKIDPDKKEVTDDKGEVTHYDRLLLATGGTPARLPFGEDILYFRTLKDYQQLAVEADEKLSFAVIGGGFIGSELAAALNIKGAEVAMLFPEAGISERLFPRDLSRFVTEYYREKGVAVMAGETVTEIAKVGSKQKITTGKGEHLVFDRVIAGIGLRPNVDLAQKAGLTIENGIWVDENLQTSAASIYAAGDAANFYNPLLEKRLRLEHEDCANSMGKHAGRNMASESPKPYTHLPFFYSDLFDLGYEAIGELDPSADIVADWIGEPYQEGVVYYLRDGRVRGVLLWNVWGKMDEARALIGEAGPFEEKNLIGLIE
jgi:3-phenylpropionate/trans-cinnamate dioxygenase ferredoxin reductase component